MGMVFLSVLCASLIIGGDIYYNMYRLIATEAPSLAAAASQFNAIILVKIFLYLCLMLLISLFISHRFAGPVFRFEKSAQIVAKGDLTHRVCLRTGDELMELQDEFNAMIAGPAGPGPGRPRRAQRLWPRGSRRSPRNPESATAACDELASLNGNFSI